MNNAAGVQWFPGHMAKTRRLISSSLRLVDIVVEITDARIPFSSRNPEMDKLCNNKKRVILLNKCDYADPNMNDRWLNYYSSKGIPAVLTDCRSGKGLKTLSGIIREALKEQLSRQKAKGMETKPIRMMVVGIPNVGKSSFINRLANGRKAKVEDRPGVTKGCQWVSTSDNMELLDMPGVLWPKFDDPLVGERLAFTGAVKDDILDIEYLAIRLIDVLREKYSALLDARYNISDYAELESYDVLKMIASKRGMLVTGGEVDTERASIMLFDEFRSGKIGRITLEAPEE